MDFKSKHLGDFVESDHHQPIISTSSVVSICDPLMSKSKKKQIHLNSKREPPQQPFAERPAL